MPVVRKTGGLNDTVFDVDDDEERASSQGMVTNGYNFEGTDAGGVDYALNRALAAWNNDKQASSFAAVPNPSDCGPSLDCHHGHHSNVVMGGDLVQASDWRCKGISCTPM